MTGTLGQRPILASGLCSPNSAEVDAIRGFIQHRLPWDSQGGIALESGKTRGRVAEEMEGKKPLSLDVATLAIGKLSLEHRLQVMAHIAEPMGLTVSVQGDGSL